MTDFDHASLDRVLPPFQGAPDWQDVLSRAPAHRRRHIVLAAVAALVVAAGSAAAFGTVRELILHRGFIGLPPIGAAPSSPERAKLELFYWVSSPELRRPPTGPWDGNIGRSRAWVYSDGRLIWLREATISDGANRWSTGFLEQRLTREGVERLRSEIVSNGVFGKDERWPFGGERIQVRKGDRLLAVKWSKEVERADTQRLEARLSDPATWLPASAWANRVVRAYVPSRFEVCVHWPWHSYELSRILVLLPGPVAARLAQSERKHQELKSGALYCSDLRTEEARTLATTLDDAGFEREAADYGLGYRVRVPGSRDPALVDFEPYLPHGETTCSECG